MKKLALFDIDGVVYRGHSIFDIIQDQEKKGLITKGTWSKILLEIEKYKSGKKDYKQAANGMLDAYAISLKDKKYKDVVDHNTNYFTENKDKFFPYFQKLIPQLSETYEIYFVTTNFQFTAEAIGKIFNIRNYISSIAEVKDGLFTGKVGLSLGGNKGIVADLIKKYGKSGSIAVGDSENDADMLDLVEFPIVISPNEKLQAIAKEKGWEVVNHSTITDIIVSHDYTS